jgi:hypothetical protein
MNETPYTPRSEKEANFMRAMLAYYRGAGKHDAYMLLDKMIDDCDDGAFREDMMRMVTTALAELPTKH